MRLNQLDEALNQQSFEEFLVLGGALVDARVEAAFDGALQTFDELIQSAHAVDTLAVLLGTLLNLQVYFGDLEVLFRLLFESLLLGVNCLFEADSEFVVCLPLDLLHAVVAVRFDEVNHGAKDILGLG